MIEDVLLIDTSIEVGFVALFHGKKQIFSVPLLGRESAQELVAVLEKELREHAVSLKSIGFIAVAIGPGSYTGLRLGIIAAQTLAYALDKPLVGVPSLRAYAPPSSFEGKYAVALDAKMGGVYVALGEQRREKRVLKPAQICSVEEFAVLLPEVEIVLSPHCQKLQQRLVEFPSNPFRGQWLGEEGKGIPNPDCLLEAAIEYYETRSSQVGKAIDILYLRPSQAEIESKTD